jgi:broad specificity phosphatase PhoE
MCSTSGVLLLVRHGRTDANARGLLQGRMDVPLDEVGMEQAAEVAKALATPDRVISSPLLRARATAEAFGLPVEIDERWIELDYGELDGSPVASVGLEVWKEWRADLGFAPPGGESIRSMAERVLDACQEIVISAADEDIVVVSHVSPIKAAVTWVLGVSTETGWRTHLDAASITRVACGPHSPVLRSFNETGHLSHVVGPVRLSG